MDDIKVEFSLSPEDAAAKLAAALQPVLAELIASFEKLLREGPREV